MRHSKFVFVRSSFGEGLHHRYSLYLIKVSRTMKSNKTQITTDKSQTQSPKGKKQLWQGLSDSQQEQVSGGYYYPSTTGYGGGCVYY